MARRAPCVAWDLGHPVPYAPSADLAVVCDADGVFAVELVDPPQREPAMDLTRELGWLRVDGLSRIPLGGDAARERLIDRGATFTAADLLGGAQRALGMAVEYAKDRVQFGRPIGSFQAVKHRCADMLVDVEGMRSTVYWAAWCIGADDADASIAASTAKIWCSDASKRVMASALQVHGGIGFTWEHDLHFFLKRAPARSAVVRRRRVPPRPPHRAVAPKSRSRRKHRLRRLRRTTRATARRGERGGRGGSCGAPVGPSDQNVRGNSEMGAAGMRRRSRLRRSCGGRAPRRRPPHERQIRP